MMSESSSTYRLESTYNATMRIDCDTEITGKPVCLDARSAVRWRVPDSVVSIEESGSNCTAARKIRVASRSMMTAPSIVQSWRGRVAEEERARAKPPEERAPK